MTEKTLDQKLVDTRIWIGLRDILIHAINQTRQSAIIQEFLDHEWPPNTVPRQDEVAALEQRYRRLEKALRTLVDEVGFCPVCSRHPGPGGRGHSERCLLRELPCDQEAKEKIDD